jgi:hypothetical protein
MTSIQPVSAQWALKTLVNDHTDRAVPNRRHVLHGSQCHQVLQALARHAKGV